jgi:hypothetical protein
MTRFPDGKTSPSRSSAFPENALEAAFELKIDLRARGYPGLAMSVERARRAWVRAVNAHLRAAASHETAAELFATFHDSKLAMRESDLAAAERKTYEIELARHPDWADDVRGLAR